MHKVRVYVDTSVFGGAEDVEFAAPTRQFFERVKNGEFVLVVSAEVLRELRGAPDAVRNVLAGVPDDCLEDASISEEVISLAQAYVSGGVLDKASLADALHVAAATVSEADVIVSWNFKHVVNYERIRKYNAVNALNGYRTIEIRSPSEMTHGDND